MSYVPRELEYDLFVSYARRDNEAQNAGKVSALVRAIAECYQRKHNTALRIFFDERPLLDGNDRERGDRQNANLRALNRSTMLLAVLSPENFANPGCEREFECHQNCCRENGLSENQAVAVSIVSYPPLPQPGTRSEDRGWSDWLQRTPIVDCQSWWREWKLGAESKEVEETIGQIAAAIYDSLTLIPDRLTPIILADDSMGPREDLDEPVLDRPTVCSAPAEDAPALEGHLQPDSSAARIEPIELTENVQFTVFKPRAVPPSQWRSLLAFAHLAELPPEADPHEPDPLQEMERLAKQVLGSEFESYGKTTQDSTSAVPRQGLIVFIPTVEGVEFNPPRYEFQWVENVHKAEFRLRASPQLEGKTARGRLTVFSGSLILAEIALQFRVDGNAAKSESGPAERASARPYRNIFASYSHADVAIVRQFEEHAKAIGDRYLRDVVDLRSGQVWNDELMRLIEQADVFQLFWSKNAMQSQFVRQEWEYALSLRRPEFIRPTYWELPLPEAPETGMPPEHLRRIHFHFIGTEGPKKKRTDAEIAIPSRPVDPPRAASLPSQPSRAAKGRRRRPAMWLGTASAFVMLAAVGLWSFTGGEGPHHVATSGGAVPNPNHSGPIRPPDDEEIRDLDPNIAAKIIDGSSERVFRQFQTKGSQALNAGYLVDARSWFERGLKIAQQDAHSHLDDFPAQRNWITALENLARLAMREGKFPEARDYLQRDLEIWNSSLSIATRFSNLGQSVLEAELKTQMSDSLKEGALLLQQGNSDAARRSFRKYLDAAERLAKLAPAQPKG